MPDINAILQFVGQTLLTAIVSSGLLLWLGKSWIENRFNRSLKRYEYQINSVFNRVTKIHEKEFEVLSEAWELMHTALGFAYDLVVPLQTYPDLNRMSEARLEEFLSSSNLLDSDKDELRSTKDKNSLFSEKAYWYKLLDAKKSSNDFHNFLIRNKIFLSEDIKQKLNEIDTLLRESLTKSEIAEMSQKAEVMHTAYTDLNGKATNIVNEIEALVQKRLEFHTQL